MSRAPNAKAQRTHGHKSKPSPRRAVDISWDVDVEILLCRVPPLPLPHATFLGPQRSECVGFVFSFALNFGGQR